MPTPLKGGRVTGSVAASLDSDGSMQSQDHYAHALRASCERLASLGEALRDCADVEIEAAPTFWRLGLKPHVAQASAVELVVAQAAQTFDLQLGADVFEAIPLPDPVLLEAIVMAVVAGCVRIETARRAATGLWVARTWRLMFADGGAWQQQRRAPKQALDDIAEVVLTSAQPLAYRR
jgi:hypothetical protein